MESKDLEDLCNTTGPEDETMANLKKRSRRVSFADNITTFHVFDRDDEFETPPDGKPSSENENVESAVASETPGLRGDLVESDDSKELTQNENDEEEDDDEEGRELFVRNMDFSSSPGSVAGSVTSNEEDNFFGPVSTSFIRSGRLSTESATSDNDHDITMDSTAFSLHFRNLMQSDEQRSNSEGNFKTPTGVHLAFGEETCGDSMQTNGENFMVLTGIKKMIPHYTSGGRSNGGGDSNDMSLIVENPNKYDYGKLSPGLDALLAEVQHVSVSNQINISKSPKSPSSSNRLSGFYERTSEPMDLKCSGGVKVQTTKVEGIPVEVLSDAISKASDADNGNCIFTSGHKTSYSSSGINETLPADTAFGLWNGAQNEPIQGMFSGMDKESGKDSLGVSQQPQREIGCPNNGHTSSPLNKATPKNLITQHDCGPTGHITDRIEENSHFSYSSPVPVAASPMFAVLGHRQRLAESPKSGTYVPNDVQNAEKDSEPSSAGSISSLCAKRQRLSLGTSVLASTGHISTPFSAYESCSLLEKEGVEHGVRLSSMKNKISKLSLFETREVGANNPMSSLSHLANKPSLFEDILIRNNSDPKLMPVRHSDGGGHLLAHAEENTTQEIEVEMHGYRVETPKNFNRSRLSGKSPAISHGEGHGSGKHVDVNAMRLDNPIEAAVSTSQMHKTAEIKNMKKVTAVPTMFISSPVKRLEQKISPSGRVSPSRILNQQNQCGNPFGSSPSQQIEDTSRTTPNVSQLLTPGAEGTIGSISLPKSNTGRSTLPLATINTDVFRNHAKCEETASQESFLQDLQKELNSSISYQTPMSNRVNLNFYSSSQDKNAQKKECTKSGEKLSIDREFRASSHESASPNIAKRTGPRTLPEKVVQSASRKEAYNLTENDSLILPSWEFPVSSTLRQGLRGLDHNESQLSPSVQRSLLIPDADASGRKTINKSVFMEKNEMNDSNMSKRSRKVLLENEGASGFCLENHVAGITEADMIRGEPLEKHWRDVFSKFSAASEQLLPTYTDKLNTRQLGIVEDILGQLQRLQKYEKICTEIQSQKMPPHLGNILQPRVAEARWLQHALMFEQLKLQLVHLKRDRLLRKVHQLQSGILDCHSLKSNILQHHLGKRDYQNEGGCVQSDSVECSTENQDSHHTVIRMRKELGVLDHKVKRIIKFFQASCKIKGDRNPVEIVELINDHLQRQERCRIIRQYLLLWEIDDIEQKDDSRNIILNYHGFLSQRLTKNNSPVSNIVSSKLLNDANIKMSFPSLNAGIAFEFVFNYESNCWLGNPKSFQQVTRLTSFLLGNLLDVIEEVQAAQMELTNLVKASFHSPCAVQLELQLCFIDFKLGRKATLILDMTDLNCGIYPSEILPSQLKIQISGTQAAAALLSSEILDVVRNLTAGQHSMIIRLCRCVSQVFLSSSG